MMLVYLVPQGLPQILDKQELPVVEVRQTGQKNIGTTCVLILVALKGLSAGRGSRFSLQICFVMFVP